MVRVVFRVYVVWSRMEVGSWIFAMRLLGWFGLGSADCAELFLLNEPDVRRVDVMAPREA